MSTLLADVSTSVHEWTAMSGNRNPSPSPVALAMARSAFGGLTEDMRAQVIRMWEASGPPSFVVIGDKWTAGLVLPNGKPEVGVIEYRGGVWRTVLPNYAAKFSAVVHGYLLRGLIYSAGSGAGISQPAKKSRTVVSRENLTFTEKMEVIVPALLGRVLLGNELARVKAIDRIFERGQSRVSESDLHEIQGVPRGWGYMYYEVWPEPPATAWKAWLHIVHVMQKTNFPLPDFLFSITPQAEVDATVREWRRSIEIEQWKKALSHQATRKGAVAVQSPVLRARLKEKLLRMEVCLPGADKFTAVDSHSLSSWEHAWREGRLELDAGSEAVWNAWQRSRPLTSSWRFSDDGFDPVLRALVKPSIPPDKFIGPAGEPVVVAPEPARWRIKAPEDAGGDYRWQLETADGEPVRNILAMTDGDPSLIVTADCIFKGPPLMGLEAALMGPQGAAIIPAPAMESESGVAVIAATRAPLPQRIAGRIRRVTRRVLMCASLEPAPYLGSSVELLRVKFKSIDTEGREAGSYNFHGWHSLPFAKRKGEESIILSIDDSALERAPEIVRNLELIWSHGSSSWEKRTGRQFPVQFAAWLANVPDGVVLDLDPVLASLAQPDVAARLTLDFAESESGIDWFDLRVSLTTDDTTLTEDETAMLLKAKGGYVRLGAKGWRKLTLHLSEDEERELADLGLSASDFSGPPQRIHALQIAGSAAAKRALPPERAAAIERTAASIRTRSTPDVPASLKADLRPYQRDGYHFLSYLTANRFGGILADDMGLGKTVQALAWLLWLRGQENPEHPALVVCPKSVTDNWVTESARFAPDLRVVRLERAGNEAAVTEARNQADIVVLNYTQLRLLEGALKAVPWHAAIMDEAQVIKNPQSQTAIAACALAAPHRLALSGTPIENRLLDLWSIMNFAMPGVLGNRAAFQRLYDSKADPLARRRLAARVRPFVLRRTKNEVARDLPDRIEEDLHCELEGPQATLYRAELKRARKALLGLTSGRELDKARFHILTSLLRLRQICCHPALVAAGSKADSSKLTALLELLEPLMEEGHKVLVFSQFVEMLNLIRTELEAREWRHFVLTGQTEHRGDLVSEFQSAEGAAVFLISLRAGGFGLNLTAASYVVIFDPWWNPAVENQAIDRTHRIGQTRTVIAYRLLVKDTIEEKIRILQQQKSALAGDILGEESFARALTLDDFQFLFAEEP